MSILDDIRAGIRAFGDAFTGGRDIEPEAMAKALRDAGLTDEGGLPEASDEKPRALFHDPYSVVDWGGWRERPSALTYETLRQMTTRNTVIAALITLRCNQVAQFSRPQQGKYDRGYRIIKRDRRDRWKSMTPTEQKRAAEIERMIETTGILLPDEKPSDRDSFTLFVKKGVRDILTYDQWCHPAGTLVQMADGTLRAIENVLPGEAVVTHLGRVRRVKEVLSREYTGQMRRLRYRGQEIVATDGHPLLVERGAHLTMRHAWKNPSYSREWVAAKDIHEGEYLTSPDVAPFGERSELSVPLARVLGLYAGDGHRSGAAAVWTFHEDETDLVEAVLAVFPEAIVDPYVDRAAVSVRVNGQGEWFAVRCGDGSGSKRVPHEILHGALAQRRAFLRGCIEADGHLTPTGAVLSTTSLALRGGVTLLAAMDGMFVSWSETANAGHGWAPCWQGRFSGESYRAFARGAGLRVCEPDRARDPSVHADGYHYLRVNRVEMFNVERVMVYNLEVDEDHSYIANGVVSHNCFEKIRDRRGMVSRFIALPSETVRPAVSDAEHLSPEEQHSRVAYVQVYEDSVIAEFSPEDLAWCIMNPRSDLRVNGFGFSPVEQLMHLVTAWLFGFEYNQRFFSQGSAIKGILNIKGAIPDRQLRAFRRMWYSQVTGVTNAWRTPILNSEDIQWQSLHSTNREMEFSAWMDWLTKLTCAIYGADPVEINFQFGNTGQSHSLNEGKQEAKLTESKDKGLRPLMDHISDNLNRHLVWDIEPEFEFSFVGLDADDEEKEREARIKEVGAYRMVDEVRADDDLPPLPDGLGQVINNPTWLQFAQAKQQEKMMQEQQAAAGGDPNAPPGPPGGPESFDDDDGAPEPPDDEEELQGADLDEGDLPEEAQLERSMRNVDRLLKSVRRRTERGRLVIEMDLE